MRTMKTPPIRGKVVSAIHLNPFPDGRGEYSYDPCIHFTDGTVLAFSVAETDNAEYGVTPIYPARCGKGE